MGMSMVQPRRPVPLISALLAAACLAPADLDPDPLSGLPEVVPTEALRLGGPDAPEPLAFEASPAFTVGPDGDLFVLHRTRGSVARVGRDGELIRWIGSRGPGPGEFQSPGGLGLAGDTLWVRDFPSLRIVLFDETGAHLDSHLVPYDFGYTFASPQGGSALVHGGRVLVVPGASVLGIEGSIELPVLLGSPGSEAWDTLFTARSPRGQIGGIQVPRPPEPPLFSVSPRGSRIVVVDWPNAAEGEVRIVTHDLEAEAAHEISLGLPPRPVTPQVRDSIVDAVGRHMDGVVGRALDAGIPASELPDTDRTGVMQALSLPEHLSPVDGVVAGQDGTTWLRLAGGAGPWLVLAPGGDPWFTVPFPPGADLRHASSTEAWTTEEDELGVAYIVRWDLDRERAPLGLGR
jgi:hypothetical protein